MHLPPPHALQGRLSGRRRLHWASALQQRWPGRAWCAAAADVCSPCRSARCWLCNYLPLHATPAPHRARAPQPGPLIPAMLPGKFTAGPRPRGTRRRGEGGGGIFKQAAVEVLRLEKRLMSTGGSVRGPLCCWLAARPLVCSLRLLHSHVPITARCCRLLNLPRRRNCARGAEAWPDQVHRQDSRGNHGLRAVSAVVAWVLVAARLAPACKWCTLPSAIR